MVEKKLLYNTGEREAYCDGRSRYYLKLARRRRETAGGPVWGGGGSVRESGRRSSSCPYSSGVGGDPRRLAAVGLTLRPACRAVHCRPLQFQIAPVASACANVLNVVHVCHRRCVVLQDSAKVRSACRGVSACTTPIRRRLIPC